MLSRRLFGIVGLCAVLTPLVVVQPAAAARRAPFPNIKGTWVGTYRTSQGGTGTLDVEITSNTARSGRILGTLQDDKDSPSPGQVLQLTGNITKATKKKRPVWTTKARGKGIVSNKVGKLLKGNNKITGEYRDNPGGTGTFVLNRVVDPGITARR